MIARLCLLMLASLSVAAFAAEPATDVATSAQQDILRVEARVCRAFETGDADVLRRDLDPTFTLVDSRGTVTDYAANVAEVEKRDPVYTVFRNHDQDVRVYGDSAIVTGITTVEGHSGETKFAADFRFTDTWVKRKEGWKLAASHASKLVN